MVIIKKLFKFRKNRPFWVMLAAAFCLIIAIILVFQFLDMDTTAFALKYKNSLAAIPILIFLYLLKSVTVVLLPQPMVYLATGLLFSPLIAFLFTLVFLLMEFSLDYFVGKRFGKRWLDKLLRWLRGRSKTLDRMLDSDALNRFGSIAALRLMPGVSTDSVSLLAGAQNVYFPRFLLASYVGALPQAIALTLMGSSAHDPLSPEFLIPMGAFFFILFVTLCVKHYLEKKRPAPSASSSVKNED